MVLRPNISFQRTSWPLWVIVIILGVMVILGVIIGLLVHFLAIGKMYHYQGDFRISGIMYNSSCETTASQANTELTRDIEAKMLSVFQNSRIYEKYVSSQIIKFLPYRNGSRVLLHLLFKFPPGKRHSMRTKIRATLYRMLRDNMATWKAVPTSINIIGCGRPLVNSIATGNRIVNGKNAQEGAWPWMASMQWRGTHFCGASLVGSRWLLSAAHCFAKKTSLKDWTVNFGLAVNKPYMTHKVRRIILHEHFKSPGVQNDIALVELANEVSFTKYIRKICLPEANMKLSQQDSVVATGWGALSMNGPWPVILQEAPLKIIDNENCNAPHVLSGLVLDTMLCAGYLSGEADACQNDSGGPLAYIDSRKIWHLVGIVSWGDGCAKKNKPGVYTRVSSYRDWIISKTGL
ncbi:transmembrane protease serine 11B-like [Thomomys bottae]